MDWLEKEKQAKQRKIELKEKISKSWNEAYSSGITLLIEEVKNEIEKDTDLRYALTGGGHSLEYGEGVVAVRGSSGYFEIFATADAVYLKKDDRDLKRIYPREITKKDVYKWFKEISG